MSQSRAKLEDLSSGFIVLKLLSALTTCQVSPNGNVLVQRLKCERLRVYVFKADYVIISFSAALIPFTLKIVVQCTLHNMPLRIDR